MKFQLHAIATLTLAVATACGAPSQEAAESKSGHSDLPRRIVSLIPATTEMLFAMGAGDRLVGIGTYDHFPPEVERIRRVGGLVDPDTEAIIALKPDLVIVYNTQTELKQRLERAGLPYFSYQHRAVPDIMETIRELGRRIGESDDADALADEISAALESVRTSVAGRPRPATMLVFGREPGTLRNVYASGAYGFLADLLDIAGGENVFGEIDRESVQASTEMILARHPEVIIELRYGDRERDIDSATAALDWNALPSLPAVRNSRVYVLTGDQFVVPGPRIVQAARQFADVLHGSTR